MSYEFKSTSTEQEVMTRPQSCGVAAGPRTIFVVDACHAYKITKFIFFQGDQSEHEVLFRPLSKFRILTSSKQIVDPHEMVSLECSGFPDVVNLQQISETPSAAPFDAPHPPPLRAAPPLQVSHIFEEEQLVHSLEASRLDAERQALPADVNSVDARGWTPLMQASYDGNDLRARVLIEKGADVGAQNNEGVTALMFAALNGHDVCARVLLEKGADASYAKADGWTALMLAAQNGHDLCARVLIEAGAQKDANNKYGGTALGIARALAPPDRREAICELLEA